MSAEVRQLRSVPRPQPETVEAPATIYPRIEPGVYAGVTREVDLLRMWRRSIVRLQVDVYMSDELFGQPPLARVPYFLSCPEQKGWRVAATSSIVRLFLLLGIEIPARGPLPLGLLVGKRIRVQVGDVQESRDVNERGRKLRLPAALVYSKIKRVLERL